MSIRRLISTAATGLAIAMLATGCTAPSTAVEEPSIPSVGESGAFTPLTATVITPPTPLPASDGETHLAFELLITNTAPRAATLTRVVITDAVDESAVLSDLSGPQLLERTVLAGDLANSPTSTIPEFSTVLVVVDAIAVDGVVPSALQPHVSADFEAPQADQPPYVSIFPDQITEDLPAFPVGTGAVVSLGAPLAGGNWGMLNACCILSAHRGAVLGRDGRLVAPERYAVDFTRIGDDGRYFSGEAHTIDSDLSYGAELLAVADGTVISVTDDLPDQPMGVNPTGYSLEQLAGNQIVLQLGIGVYALYAHNAPGSPLVKVGDEVKKGQVLALLGNSGNSTAPHLHFHLMDSPQPLNSDGLPYTWERYSLLGQPDAAGEFQLLATPEQQTGRYALATAVVRFPDRSQ